LHNRIPFSVSGENLIILAQNLAIVALLWRYNKKITKAEKYTLTALYLIYAAVLLSDRFLKDKHWKFIANTNILLCKKSTILILKLVLLSRLPQIMINYKHKSTG